MEITLSDEAERKVSELKSRYPDKKSAVMPALYVAQEELGYLNRKAILWVSARLEIPPVHVLEVATFYTMYYKKPVGKYHFQVCRTLSCAIRGGGKKITSYLKKRFGIEPNEVTPDGMWSYEEVECLGSCGTAPMCEINDVYFENLTEEKIEEIIKRIEAEEPDLRYSTIRDELGKGLEDLGRSKVV
ncbi:MAG: NAD(P)H-dependent oxidoreductase subunit E [Candidatus Dadabacteria bacterium]|nr:MAG: NAD(P)H-dependent oxidoreductase subunit E [Candidatus Dadabacteria bacterium]